jgi:signal transduction histidine kinase
MSEEIKNNDTEITATFKPRARLLTQLGDQLIKNESIALVELVKNSYDADANSVNIYMENVESETEGIIIIEDDGYGMSEYTVENVWLEPGSDFKSEKIKKLEVSPKFKRLPIGEKGIGRFGVHKLGNVIELTTKTENTDEVYVRIDWRDFGNYKYLDQVPIHIKTRKVPQIFKNNKTGTVISISNLRKPWERGIAREVKRSITSLISPFDTKDSFKPKFEILDKPGWFDGLLKWDDVEDYSLFYFKITLENKSIIDFKYEFRPWQSMSLLEGRSVDLNDKIVEVYKTLKCQDESNNDIPISLSKHQIGQVIFEGYVFDLDSFILKLGVSDKKGFKDYLKSNGGVRVFRDGLRVYDYGEPENDWLGLDYRRFQQPSKAISNNLILGAIYLNRKDSSDLEEKTNREGFVDNDAYKAFKNSILHCLNLIESLRIIDKKKLKDVYGPTPKSSPVMHILSEAKNFVNDKVREKDTRNKIISYLDKIEIDYKRVTENLLKAAGAGLSMSVVVHEVEKIISEVIKVVKAEKGSTRVLNLVEHLSSLIDGYSEIIRKSNQSDENVIEVINQALFNTEYRLASHKIGIIKDYKNFNGNKKVKIAKNLLIGTIMNIIDNSIYWLEKEKERKPKLEKKIYINIIEEESYLNIVFSDNGTGFLIPTDDVVEPFVSAKPGGIGLGLHIANEIMIAQKGKLIFPDNGDYIIPNEFSSGATIVLALKK